MKTTLTLAIFLTCWFASGCGFVAGAHLGRHFGKKGWLKGDLATPVTETYALEDDVTEAAAGIEQRPVGIVTIYERTPGAADALVTALNDAGFEYRIAAASAPYAIEGQSGATSQGRAVLLALEPAPDQDHVTIENPQSGVFDHAARGTDGRPRTRAWASIDVDIDDRRLRIIAADLKTDDPEVRAAWAFELGSGPGATAREVIYPIDAGTP